LANLSFKEKEPKRKLDLYSVKKQKLKSKTLKISKNPFFTLGN
jgi:hypothetical protein